MNENMIHDCIYYGFEQSGASNDKAEGVIVGVVGVLCASMSFESACAIVAKSIKHLESRHPTERFRTECVPKAWHDEIFKLCRNIPRHRRCHG